MIRSVCLIVVVAFVAALNPAELRSQQSARDRREARQPAQGRVRFTPNRGQIVDTRGVRRPDVLYAASTGDVRLFVRAEGISTVFSRAAEGGDHGAHDEGTPNRSCGPSSHIVEQVRVDALLVGANPEPAVLEESRSTGHENFYLEHCPEGILRVPSFHRLTVRDVWPGIDMVLTGLEQGVKRDFIVRPGARVTDIRIRYVAAESVALEPDGSLRIRTKLGDILEAPPVVYIDGPTPKPIQARYWQEGEEVGFEVASHGRDDLLVIDPVLRWSTYYGRGNNESLGGGDPTEVDRAGNAIFGGIVDANTFPTSPGAFQTAYGGGTGDAIVVKFDGDGLWHWATYYGGSGDDRVHAVVSDSSLNVLVAGHTQSSNFPVSTGAHQTSYGGVRDAFAVKLDTGGARLWGTFYGGSYWDDGYGFAADSAGNVALLVTAASSNLQTSGMTAKPTAAGSNDVLIARLTASGSQDWATYIGGNGDEIGYAAGTDTSQAIIIAGWTTSNNFPTQNAAQSTFGGATDLFVAKFNRTGSLLWSTYYGGAGVECDETSPFAREQGFCGVATDGAGNVFVTGLTTGGFPTTTGAIQTTFAGGTRDAFLLKFSASGARQWATYFGGSGDDVGTGVAARSDGAVLMTGWSASANMPTTSDCALCRNQGGRDVMIVRLDSAGALDYSDYYGGSATDEGHGISFDPFGSMVIAGITFSTNFRTLNAHQAAKGGTGTGTSDAFVMVFCDPVPPSVTVSGSLTFCLGDSVVLEAEDGFRSYRWNDGSTARRLVVRRSGSYVVNALGQNSCEATSDTIRVRVNTPVRAVITPGPSLRMCFGDTIVLDAGPGFASYHWIPSGDTSRRIVLTRGGTFRVATVDLNGCSDTSATVTVDAFPRPDTAIISPRGPHELCAGDSLILSCSGSPTDIYTWSDGVVGQSRPVTVSGRYSVVVRNSYGCSRRAAEVGVTVHPKPLPVISSDKGSLVCAGDSVRLSAQPGFASYRWSTGDTTPWIVVGESGTYAVTVRDTNGCEATADYPVTVIENAKPPIDITGGTRLCEGDTAVLTAVGFFRSFTWSNGAIGRSIRVTEPGAYFVTAVGAYDCSVTSDTVRITVNARPTALFTGPLTVCAGTRASYSLEGRDSLTYEWSLVGNGASIVSGAGTAGIEVQWGSTGTGSVRVKVTHRGTGCTATAELLVTIGTTLVPAITPSGDVDLCAGDSITLDAGEGYVSYRWSTGSTARAITVGAAGSYSVTVANAQGCSGTSAAVRVAVRPLPTPEISPSGVVRICAGDRVTLTTGEYDEYRWSDGQTSRSISVGTPGIYTVTVRDAFGCRGISTAVRVEVTEIPPIAVDGPRQVCRGTTAVYCIPDGIGSEIFWTVAGGAIASGQGTRCITVDWGSALSGSVGLSLREASSGCRGTATGLNVEIGTALKPRITAVGSTEICAGDSVTLEAPPGYSVYRWSNGATTRTTRVRGGFHRLEIIDVNGCGGSDTITIAERPPVVPQISGGPLTICEGDTATLISELVFPSYRWTNDATGEFVGAERVLRVSVAGAYRLSIIDAFGCSGTSTAAVSVLPRPAQPRITRRNGLLESTPAFRYQWILDGTDIAGATARQLAPASQGSYRIRITDENGCIALSDAWTEGSATALVGLPDISASPGDRVEIPLTFLSSSGLDDAGAIEFTATVRFNRTLLFPIGNTPRGYVDGRERVITLAGRRAPGLENGPAFTLEFIAALGDTTESPLRLEVFEFAGGDVQIATVDGRLEIIPKGGWFRYLSGEALAIYPATPDPVVDHATIAFQTIEPGRTLVMLYDVLGREVDRLFDADIDAGRHSFLIDSDKYAAGVYFLLLVTPTDRAAASIHIAD